MLPRENHLFGGTGPKPSQASVLAGLTLAGDFGFSFQCQVGSSLVLRRPIEITRVTGHLVFGRFHLSSLCVYPELTGKLRSKSYGSRRANFQICSKQHRQSRRGCLGSSRKRQMICLEAEKSSEDEREYRAGARPES
jgi:hypothetical protein